MSITSFLRLMLVDDHTIMREGLKQLFSLMPGVEVVAEADNGASALARLREGGVDVLVLDMTMPGISGEDLIARIHAHHPDIAILVLSMHNELQIAQRALKSGARGYVTKDQSPEVLQAAVRKVAMGHQFIDPELAQRMAFEAIGVNQRPDHECLTDREFQVLRLLARGARVNDVADELCISNKTVSTHKARLMEKMNFSSTSELVRYAMTHGLIN